MRVRSAFDRWASRQDATALVALGGAGAWLVATALVLALVAVGSWIPATAHHIQLEAGAALAAFALPAAGGFGLALTHERGRPFTRREILSTLWTSATLQVFCAVLIARSSMLGAVLFFPALLFTATVHGFVFRSTLREPFPTLGTGLATVVGVGLCRGMEQAVLVGLSGMLASAGSLLLGTLAVRADESRQRRAQLRETVVAQRLADETANVRRLSESLVDMMGSVHDIANVLSLVHLSTSLLTSLRASVVGEGREILAQVEHSLERCRSRIDRMLADTRRRYAVAGASVPPAVEPVEVSSVAQEVVDAMAQRSPDLSITTDVPPTARVDVAGGAPALVRVLENLVLNAEQGNGRLGADRVLIRCTSEPHAGAHRIVVEDDGPGFDPHLLEMPVAAFSTTKTSGTGLGLYTVERLVAASSGSLVRANVPGAGARVTVTLPRSAK